jgi:hypothetical protein
MNLSNLEQINQFIKENGNSVEQKIYETKL